MAGGDECWTTTCGELTNEFWMSACCDCLGVAGEMFWHLADLFYEGHIAPDHPLAPHLAKVMAGPEVCGLARAIAYLLTAELAVWISLVVSARIATEEARLFFSGEVMHYVLWLVSEASQLVPGGDFKGFDFASLGKASQLPKLLGSIHEAGVPEVCALGNSRVEDRDFDFVEVALLNAVGDRFWREVFFPAILVPGVPFWSAPLITGTATPAGLEIMQQVPTFFSSFQESALQVLLHRVLDELQKLQREGVLGAFWAESSTLIALLRYGALFGRFEDGARDCVDDDLDFAVSLGPAPSDLHCQAWGGWYCFVREMAIALQAFDASCSLVGSMKYAVDDSAVDEDFFKQLFCICKVGHFTLPVSFRIHSGEGLEPPALTSCSAYGRSTPCPRDHVGWLVKYHGCVALPKLEYSTLTTGDSCVSWMESGLSSERVSQLLAFSMRLTDEGFASMEGIWQGPECETEREAFRRGDVVSVGQLLAQQERLKAAREF